MITSIRKRDGREVPFNLEKISTAINKALHATGEGNDQLALQLAIKVLQHAEKELALDAIPTVEEIQDIVEKVLIEADLPKAAKAYILYRADRTRAREMNTRLMQTYEEITNVDSDRKSVV
jgi:ribonucleoside-triphosphate reductase